MRLTWAALPVLDVLRPGPRIRHVPHPGGSCVQRILDQGPAKERLGEGWKGVRVYDSMSRTEQNPDTGRAYVSFAS